MTTNENSWIDPDDAPEWTDADFEGAEIRIGDKIIRPAAETPSIVAASAIDRSAVNQESCE